MHLPILRLEEIALNAWPAFQQVLYDGWILRSASGYTKRANSVNPLYPSSLDLDGKISFCEAYYDRRNLPSIFRLTAEATPPELDQTLAGRGYAHSDSTRVMVRDLSNLPPVAGHRSIKFEPIGLDRWLSIHTEIKNLPAAASEKHRDILRAIPLPVCFGILLAGEAVVACGLAVLESGLVGLFDLVTATGDRRRGYGTRLVQELLVWGQDQGATETYLQVMEENRPAYRLYKKLGFTTRYTYWYRISPHTSFSENRKAN